MTTIELATHLPTEVNPRFLTSLLESLRRRFPEDPPRYDQLREALHYATTTGATRYSYAAPSPLGPKPTAVPRADGTGLARNTPGTPPAASRPVASWATDLFATILQRLALQLCAWAITLRSRSSNPFPAPAPNQRPIRDRRSLASRAPRSSPPPATSAHSIKQS